VIIFLFWGLNPTRLILGQQRAGPLHPQDLYLSAEMETFAYYLNDVSPVSILQQNGTAGKNISYLGIGQYQTGFKISAPFSTRQRKQHGPAMKPSGHHIPGFGHGATICGMALGVLAAVKKQLDEI
jgi:hypothetical protein